MIRGSTPTHFFTLPFDTEIIDKVKVIYAQEDNVILTKEKESCDFEGKIIRVKLSQLDTFKFEENKLVQIQLRILTTDGNALVSKIQLFSVEKCLDDEVLE